MAEKDMTEKALEAHNDVFADIVNNLLFQGMPYVLEYELEQGRERSVYTGERSFREQERDTSKFWKMSSIRIACIGFENDFRIVADYFVQMRKNNSYIPSKIQFRHVREVRQLISALTNDRRFEAGCWYAVGNCETYRKQGNRCSQTNIYYEVNYSLNCRK